MRDPAGFIAAQTEVLAPPHVPELRLHLASEIVPIWRQTEEELAAQGLPPPFWAFAWAGGQALARYLLDHPETVRDRRVLDYGSGSGLAGIAAARAGASAVLAADIDVFAGAAARLNAALNGVALETTAEDVTGRTGPWDVVLAGDVCYEQPMAERVTRWLRGLATGGCLVLVGDPGRAYLPQGGLARLATYDVATTRELEDREVRRTHVYRIMPDDGSQ